MMDFSLVNLVALPVGLGLLGFVEPCSIGTTLLFVQALEGKSAGEKVKQTLVFAAIRTIVIGGLGLVAAMAGTLFLGFQRGAWIGLGLLYMVIGIIYLAGRSALLQAPLGARLRSPAALGVLFGLNIPACAAPLLLALLGGAAAAGASGATMLAGFASLALFGLALSLPIIIVVLFEWARFWLDQLSGLAGRLPVWTGLLFIGLGVWSIAFALRASI